VRVATAVSYRQQKKKKKKKKGTIGWLGTGSQFEGKVVAGKIMHTRDVRIRGEEKTSIVSPSLRVA